MVDSLLRPIDDYYSFQSMKSNDIKCVLHIRLHDPFV